uniref:Uncharacterized protein n=1 Tax=Pipistrellus kuhlii TaxID=59472 RepID=A0A7J7VBZ4_PIPKU|nr:hypothetical protein mPipKuh1_008538 [Pipistrellus kuhlii]
MCESVCVCECVYVCECVCVSVCVCVCVCVCPGVNHLSHLSPELRRHYCPILRIRKQAHQGAMTRLTRSAQQPLSPMFLACNTETALDWNRRRSRREACRTGLVLFCQFAGAPSLRSTGGTSQPTEAAAACEEGAERSGQAQGLGPSLAAEHGSEHPLKPHGEGVTAPGGGPPRTHTSALPGDSENPPASSL